MSRWRVGAEPAVAAPGLAGGESAALRVALPRPRLCQPPHGTAAAALPSHWPRARRCGWHMGASMRWAWGQGAARACAGVPAGCSALARWPWAGHDAQGLRGGGAAAAPAARQGSLWPARQGEAQELKPRGGSWGLPALQPCPGAGAGGRLSPPRWHPPGGCVRLCPARHGPGTPWEPGNLSASEYCSSLSLSGEIKKKKGAFFFGV